MREILESQQPDIQKKEQEIATDIQENIPIVTGDASYLRQALSNLISNAVKYTPEKGKITVRLFRLEKQVHFEVIDTGYGIPKDAQEQLFSQFYRVRTTATAGIPGTGLGLSLVKSVVEDHGGTTGFESEEGKGSTFFVHLPLRDDQPDS